MPEIFFIIRTEGFKFEVLGLLLAVFQQLEQCISYRLPMKKIVKQANLDGRAAVYELKFG